MYVIKRDGSKVEFDRQKIINAINAAFLEVDGILYETDTAEDIATEIGALVAKNENGVSVEAIQNKVEEYLMRSERKDVARAYIRFRYKREVAREYKADFMKAFSEKLEARNVKNQNANVDEYSFGGRMGEANGLMTKEYALEYCISPMAKKNSRNTKGRIISAAWKLFYEQGYEETTVEDIVFESGTSKGSFYHYFDGKDALMGTLAYVLDEKYEELKPTLDPEREAIETLVYINHELYAMIESSVSIDLLTRLLSTQLLARGEKHLLDRNRVYFRLLRQIVRQGVERGELRPDLTVDEIVKAFAMWERAQLYDWCLCSGDYSLVTYADKMTPLFLKSFRAEL